MKKKEFSKPAGGIEALQLLPGEKTSPARRRRKNYFCPMQAGGGETRAKKKKKKGGKKNNPGAWSRKENLPQKCYQECRLPVMPREKGGKRNFLLPRDAPAKEEGIADSHGQTVEEGGGPRCPFAKKKRGRGNGVGGTTLVDFLIIEKKKRRSKWERGERAATNSLLGEAALKGGWISSDIVARMGQKEGKKTYLLTETKETNHDKKNLPASPVRQR